MSSAPALDAHTVRHFERETPYPIPFITVYCYNRSTLFLVVVVNPLPCLTYKLTSSQVGTGKSRAYLGFGTMHDFRCPLGVLESIPHGQGGMTMLSFILWMFRESREKRKEKKAGTRPCGGSSRFTPSPDPVVPFRLLRMSLASCKVFRPFLAASSARALAASARARSWSAVCKHVAGEGTSPPR